MKRNKKIALVSHCILNANSKVEGLSEYGGMLKDVMNYLMDEGYGIIQMPCPEMAIYGIKRWGHVKEQFDTPHSFEEQVSFIPQLGLLSIPIKSDTS